MEQTVDRKWELDSVYAGGSGSEKLKKVMAGLHAETGELLEALQDHKLTVNKTYFASVLERMQAILESWEEIDDFLVCVYAENVEDREAVNLMDDSAVIRAKIGALQTKLDGLLAGIPEEAWHQFTEQEEIKPVSFYLSERRRMAQDRLPPELEQLIGKLSVNGFDGWEQLHSQLVSKLKFPLQGAPEEGVSIGHAYTQAMYASNRRDRQHAAAVIKEVCGTQADVYASVLNRIAGFRLDVYRQRGWDNLLKESLEQNRITEESLQAMLEAIRQQSGHINAYLRRKAEVEGIDQLAWYDLESPNFKPDSVVPYEEAVRIITTQFRRFNEKVGRFAEEAFQKRWIEAENRTGKTDGGFCASFPLAKESRIFLTYRDTYQDVVTIAHELGHAYHNFILHQEPPFAREKGTSVAETASTFMENLVLDAAIDGAESDQEKLSLLELKIGNALKYVCTIPNVFRFEQKVYEQRKEGLLTADDMKRLLTDSENEGFGGAVSEVNEYTWMYISHFYNTKIPFYNIPYTIGYLFSNGIYALAKEKGEAFMDQYDELLRRSGSMTVEGLAKQFLGEDIAKPAFWEASLQPVREAIEEYLKLTEVSFPTDK